MIKAPIEKRQQKTKQQPSLFNFTGRGFSITRLTKLRKKDFFVIFRCEVEIVFTIGVLIFCLFVCLAGWLICCCCFLYHFSCFVFLVLFRLLLFFWKFRCTVFFNAPAPSVSLILATLASVYISYTLLSRYLKAPTRRICLQIETLSVADHFLWSHDLNVWFRGYIVKRN